MNREFSRYIIKHSSDFNEDVQCNWGKDCWYLVQISRNPWSETIVWSDHMEPEDAILPRDLKDLVCMLDDQMKKIDYLLHRLGKGKHIKICNDILSEYNSLFDGNRK